MRIEDRVSCTTFVHVLHEVMIFRKEELYIEINTMVLKVRKMKNSNIDVIYRGRGNTSMYEGISSEMSTK